MPENQGINASSLSSLNGEAASASGGADRIASASTIPDGQPRLSVRVIDGLAVIGIVNADVLVEGGAIRDLSAQLHRLVDEGYTRLLMDFGSVRYMSSDMLATLAGLHLRVGRAGGRLGLCGLDPVLRDVLRICRLERVLDIHAEEEVLGVGHATGDRS
jgi:anti-anti-sigma factor